LYTSKMHQINRQKINASIYERRRVDMKTAFIWTIFAGVVSTVTYKWLHIQAKERWRYTPWI